MGLKDDIAALVADLKDSPNPFKQAFGSLSDLARQLRLATGIPFICKIGPNFSIELWVDSKTNLVVTQPLVMLQVFGDKVAVQDYSGSYDQVTHDELQGEVLKRLSQLRMVQLLKVLRHELSSL